MHQQRFEFAQRKRATIQEQFADYHAKHPDIYTLFKKFAKQVRATGRAKFGAKMIMERIRWHMVTSTSGNDEDFKVNDKYTSRYVRMLIEECPEFDGFFELRRIRTP